MNPEWRPARKEPETPPGIIPLPGIEAEITPPQPLHLAHRPVEASLKQIFGEDLNDGRKVVLRTIYDTDVGGAVHPRRHTNVAVLAQIVPELIWRTDMSGRMTLDWERIVETTEWVGVVLTHGMTVDKNTQHHVTESETAKINLVVFPDRNRPTAWRLPMRDFCEMRPYGTRRRNRPLPGDGDRPPDVRVEITNTGGFGIGSPDPTDETGPSLVVQMIPEEDEAPLIIRPDSGRPTVLVEGWKRKGEDVWTGRTRLREVDKLFDVIEDGVFERYVGEKSAIRVIVVEGEVVATKRRN